MPLVEQAQQLNPAATGVASSWSAPAWMKSGGSLIGGTLKPQFNDAYAQYLAHAMHDYLAAGAGWAASRCTTNRRSRRPVTPI
jgi:glucosylceramidase